ncbi:MAG: hypothetical protein BWY50_02184 [Spirochaetes bacterium ADurb.Bin315]|nr:MAG: hypothetical protein BWY50_02184 [Spirochaetes bacterium ADurb.Bin315]
MIGMGQTFFNFMADEDDRMSVFLQAKQQLEGCHDRLIIEVRKGFVEEDELRLHHEDSGDRQLSFLSAAQSVGVPVPLLLHGKKMEHFIDSPVLLLHRKSKIFHPEADVLFHALTDELTVSILKDEADFPKTVFFFFCYILALKKDSSFFKGI